MNAIYGFQEECDKKYGATVYDLFQTTFASMPFATIVGDRVRACWPSRVGYPYEWLHKVFVVHGGLFDEDVTIKSLNKENRFHTVPVRGSFLEQGSSCV